MSQLAQNAESRIAGSGGVHLLQDSGIRRAETEADLEVVLAAQAGSSSAFDILQREYSRRLFSTILRITRNREDAEDALQDTFLQAFVALPHFECRSSIYSWLTRIAVNSALMTLRRRRSRREGHSMSLSESCEGYCPVEIEDKNLNPEQLCEVSQRCDHLENEIQRLRPQLRVPLELQLGEEYGMKDIADTLNLSVDAVKSRLYRARVHLARRILRHALVKGRVAKDGICGGQRLIA